MVVESGVTDRIHAMRRHLRAVSLADVFDLQVLGFALGLAWAYIVFFSTTVHFSTRNDVSHFNSVFGFSSIGMLAVLLVAAVATPLFSRVMRHGVAHWIAPVLMSAATLVLVIVDMDIIRQPWCSIAAVVAGAGLGVMYMAWASAFEELPLARAVVKTASSFLLAALLFALAVALPRPMGVVLTILLPIAIGFIVFGVLRVGHTPPKDEPRRVSRIAFSLRALLSLGVISLVESFMRALFFNASPIISEGSYPWLFLLATMVSVGVVVAPLFTSKELDFGAAYKACVFVLAFVFLLLPILDLGTFAADLLALIMYCVVTLLIWTLLLRVSGLYGLSMLLTFGVGWGAHVAGALVGTFSGALVGSYADLSPRLLSILALACACLVFFAYLFLFSERFMKRLTGDSVAKREGNSFSGHKPFRERCGQIAKSRGLTPREAEIMALLVKGRSTPRIQSALGLTAGTVNTHLTHLYRKLDVHDKQELIDLIEADTQSKSEQ